MPEGPATEPSPAPLSAFAGIPHEAPARWVVVCDKEDEHGWGTLGIENVLVSCDFHHPHLRCCWTRTLLDARAGEAAHKAATDKSPRQQQRDQCASQLLTVMRKLAATNGQPPSPTGQRTATAAAGSGEVADARAREIVFAGQPPSVFRVDPHGSTVYRVRGSLTLERAACGDHDDDTGDEAAPRFPLFLAMSPDPSCAAVVQPYIDGAITSLALNASGGGKPQLLLQQHVARADGVVRATYSDFMWLVCPLGNNFVSVHAHPHRVVGVSTLKRSRSAREREEAAAVFHRTPSPSAITLAFGVYAADFASKEREEEARDKIAILDAPSVYTLNRCRFGLSGMRDTASHPKRGTRRDSPIDPAAKETERKRRKKLYRLLVNPSGEEKDGACRLQRIGTLTASAPAVCERCVVPNEQTLSAVLPSRVTWPLLSSPAGDALSVTSESSLHDFASALETG